MRRFTIIVVAVIVVLAIGVFIWRALEPGALAFAGGSTVALADYREANPTGVPAELVKADIIRRGEYLAKAADCMVCHTAP
ncbi:MAG: cytochrome c, partial [Xanthobacteraceae bacterium]